VLKLKKVELLGFKSFCERTEMHFNGDGIVGIVGPNGCGKSNISDAVSWVLGEQSARLLRGTRMEDVIFNGTRDRKPLGMASVTLTLIDPEAFSPAEPEPVAPADAADAPPAGAPQNGSARARRRPGERPGEIIVTRRLFRSGESEYLLNGRLCRLRDIQDIFMGTGLGPESYAIIEQGRIGQILSSRPHDRRAVIEEAAGITRFKTKKKLAEAKLESARQNLARVNDILEEVSRQVNSLKRQAGKARRYEELRAEMNAKLTVVLASRHRDMERLAVQAALDLNLAAEEFRSCNARVERLEAEFGAAQKESFDLESQLQQSREACAAAAREAERTQQRIDYQARLAEENRTRIGQAETEIAGIESRLEELRKEIAAERSAADLVSAERSAVREQIETGTSELDGIQSHIREREREQEELRRRVICLLGQASSLRNQLAQIDEFLAGLERQSARARSEEAAANEEIAAVSAHRDSHLARLREQQLQLESLDESRRRLEASLAEAQRQAQARREQVQLLKEEISRIRARRESLEEILSHRAYTTETVKSLFAAMEQGRMEGFRPLGIFADFIEVDAEYEKAVEGFLREELEYVVVSNWEEAERGMRLLRSEMEGHATFLVYPGAQPEAGAAGEAQSSPLASQPGVRGPLRAHVRFNNGLSHAASALLPRLDRCYLAENEETARHLACQHPDFYFLLPEGLCYHGCSLSGGRKTSSGPLALKRELREIMPRLAAAMQQLEAGSAALSQAEAQIASETAALEALRQEMQNREKGTLASEHELRQIHDRLHRANARLSAARLEIDRFRQESERAAVEADRCRSQAADLENQQREAEEMLAAIRRAVAEDQARGAKAAEKLSEWRAQLAALEERKKAAQAAAARLEQTFAGEARRRGEMAQQIEAWAAERERLLRENRDLQGQLESAAARQCALQQEGRNLEAALNQRRSRMAEIEESLKTARQQLEAARGRRSTIEIQLVRLQSDLKHLEETCLRELGRPVAEIAEAGEAPLAGGELEAAEQECSSLRAKIEALGPVNVLALEEYQEAQQRLEFLDTQRKDLFESIRDTQQAIGEIDSVSRKQFLDAFERVNENFRKTFSTLFGGGVGEMRLTDETNIAESGIDIVASPPGKRLQNVLLLSGGEKALTAIALLMAVFQYQPSPFCILDEVDAPLDEANIVRFTRLIRQMSQQTQFILITHSKTTMEVAQALYGVTMQEPGVSRLVSVRFGEKSDHAVRPLVPPPARGMGNVARV
jgi:chromosome segregation protein